MCLTISKDNIDRLPQIECNVLPNEFTIVMETRNAVQQLSFERSSGADAISVEIYKSCFTVCGGRTLNVVYKYT